MTRARMPRPHEVAAARRDPRLLRAVRERQESTEWRTRGACQSVDPETFFPAPTEPADAAVSMCRNCDVQGACLAWALEAGDCHGVWGATTPRERRAMLVAWRCPVDESQPTVVAGRRLEQMTRTEGVESIVVQAELAATEVAPDLAASRLARSETRAAEQVAIEHLSIVDVVGAAAG